MIHSKLKKGKTSELLVQFHKEQQKLPRMVKNFYNVCKDENVRINKYQGIKQNMMRFYLIQESNERLFEDDEELHNLNLEKFLKGNINSIELKFIVIYINEQDYSLPQFSSFKSLMKNVRVILIRQTLQNNVYYLDYQVQNTLSETQSLIYLCDLAAMLINCQHESQIQLYDQKKDKMIRKGKEGDLSQLEVIWKNIIYQTPGLGRQKCKAIAQKYPTYQSLIQDFEITKQLKNILVGRGTKQAKIGNVIAEKLQKIFYSLNGKQTFY